MTIQRLNMIVLFFSCLAMFCNSVNAQILRTVLVEGDLSPSGREINAPRAAGINERGDILVQELGVTQGLYLIRNGQIVKIIESGDDLPDGNGTFAGFEMESQAGRFPVLNNNGHVFYAGEFSGSTTSNEGWIYWDGVENHMVAREGEPAPDGDGTHGINPAAAVINDNNQVVFRDSLQDSSLSPTALFGYDHNMQTVTRIVQRGGQVNGETVLSSPLAPGRLTNSGNFALPLSTEDSEGDYIGRMMRTTSNGFVSLADDTQSVPGLGEIFTISARRPTLNEANQVAFTGRVLSSEGLVDTLTLYDNGALIPIAIEGDPVPGTDDELDDFEFYTVNQYGTVTFIGLDGSTKGVYQSSGSGYQKLLREGESSEFGEITGVSGYQVNDFGQTAIRATFAANQTNQNQVLYYYQSGVGLQPIAVDGQPLLDGEIASIELRPSQDVNFLPMDTINNLGQIVFWAFVDDDSGLTSTINVWSRAPELPGDCNQDGTLDLLDVAPFVDLVLNNIPLPEGDINQDGFVNLLDVDGFVNLLINP